MCGRFTLRTPQQLLTKQFGAEISQAAPRYNIAPTQRILVLRSGQNGREQAWMRWGLESPAGLLINARSETAANKPTFCQAFRQHRCLIPADGFYEWRTSGRSRTPYFITLGDGRPFAFAGLYAGSQGDESCVILTTPANELLASLHNRMPAIVELADYATWLDVATPPDSLQMLLRPYPANHMTTHQVTARVNSPANDDVGCTQEHETARFLF